MSDEGFCPACGEPIKAVVVFETMPFSDAMNGAAKLVADDVQGLSDEIVNLRQQGGVMAEEMLRLITENDQLRKRNGDLEQLLDQRSWP